MKDMNTFNLEISTSSVDAYNQMRSKTLTSPFEAKRTLEAIACVRTNPVLLSLIREEESKNGCGGSKKSN